MALIPKLKQICDATTAWCEHRAIKYDIVCDENNIQGLLIFKRHNHQIRELVKYLQPEIITRGVYLEAHKIRAGTILLFSLKSINEHFLAQLLYNYDRDHMKHNYANKVLAILDGHIVTPEPAPVAPPQSLRDALLTSARELSEAQRKSPTNAVSRSSATSQHRSSIGKGHGDGADKHDNTTDNTAQATTTNSQSTNLAPTGSTKGLTKEESYKCKCGHNCSPTVNKCPKCGRIVEFTIKLDSVLAELATPPMAPAPPGGAEGLTGLGAEHQPNDLFKRFAQALQTMGQQMRLGAPLQDLLKQQGINWKLSEDRQALIFFVQNAATNAPQPIAQVGYQTLSKPQEFQKQLSAMLDFAKGQAPGTEQQRFEAAQEANKAMGDIAKSFAPQDQTKQVGGISANVQTPVSQPTAPPTPKPQPRPLTKQAADKPVGPITKASPKSLGSAASKAAGTSVKPVGNNKQPTRRMK